MRFELKVIYQDAAATHTKVWLRHRTAPEIDQEGEPACKPGSVEDSHSSGICITADLKRPTRIRREPRPWIPIWPCSERGLPCRELLPVARCALTAPFHPYRPTEAGVGGLLSAALSVGLRPPGVTWRSALWSPDFPPFRASATAYAAVKALRAATARLTRAQSMPASR